RRHPQRQEAGQRTQGAAAHRGDRVDSERIRPPAGDVQGGRLAQHDAGHDKVASGQRLARPEPILMISAGQWMGPAASGKMALPTIGDPASMSAWLRWY